MSLAQSVRAAAVPIHRDGWKFVAIFAAATIAVALFLGQTGFWIGTILTAWCAYFFRDPERVTRLEEAFVVSPADGRVSAIGPAKPPVELGLGTEPLMRVSIFMDVFSVHINRAPIGGRITRVVRKAGKFLNAELDKASVENERAGIVIEGEHGTIGVVQVAGLIARRILLWKEDEQQLVQGERYGLIRFGSRVDLYLPEGCHPRVAEGQMAIAGETVLAVFMAGPLPVPVRRD